jgi:membrane protein CcdC involved in cytochrome C biogenesis
LEGRASFPPELKGKIMKTTFDPATNLVAKIIVHICMLSTSAIMFVGAAFLFACVIKEEMTVGQATAAIAIGGFILLLSIWTFNQWIRDTKNNLV